jgi:hypothetical protein
MFAHMQNIVANVLQSDPAWFHYSSEHLRLSLLALKQDQLRSAAVHALHVDSVSLVNRDKLSYVTYILNNFQFLCLSFMSTSNDFVYMRLHEQNI